MICDCCPFDSDDGWELAFHIVTEHYRFATVICDDCGTRYTVTDEDGRRHQVHIYGPGCPTCDGSAAYSRPDDFNLPAYEVWLEMEGAA